jgi:hypothetical protein
VPATAVPHSPQNLTPAVRLVPQLPQKLTLPPLFLVNPPVFG